MSFIQDSLERAKTLAREAAERGKELAERGREFVDTTTERLQAVADSRAAQAAKTWWDGRATRIADETDKADRTAARLALVAKAFDGVRINVLGRDVGIGADVVLNFLPGGQYISAGAHAYILAEAVRFGAPAPLLRKLALRMAVDTAVSALPVAGPVLDSLRFAHAKNARDVTEFISDAIAALEHDPDIIDTVATPIR